VRKGFVKEVLSKIKYDARENEEDYYIVIEHRGTYGNIKKIPVKMITLGHGYFFIEDTQIPYHRILAVIKKDGKVVWKKRGLGDEFKF